MLERSRRLNSNALAQTNIYNFIRIRWYSWRRAVLKQVFFRT